MIVRLVVFQLLTLAWELGLPLFGEEQMTYWYHFASTGVMDWTICMSTSGGDAGLGYYDIHGEGADGGMLGQWDANAIASLQHQTAYAQHTEQGSELYNTQQQSSQSAATTYEHGSCGSSEQSVDATYEHAQVGGSEKLDAQGTGQAEMTADEYAQQQQQYAQWVAQQQQEYAQQMAYMGECSAEQQAQWAEWAQSQGMDPNDPNVWAQYQAMMDPNSYTEYANTWAEYQNMDPATWAEYQQQQQQQQAGAAQPQKKKKKSKKPKN